MKLLLDTHAFIRAASDPTKLSTAAADALRDPSNTVLLSACSVWEIVIKVDLGRLVLRLPVEQLVAQQERNGMQVLPVTAAHALAVAGLPPVHRDPFDRLLVAQARCEGAELVTVDPEIAKYPVAVRW